MTQFLKKACLSALLVGGMITPAFAEVSDPCIVATTIDSTTNQTNIITTKRLVDYRTEQVITTTSVAARYTDGGSGVSLETKTFAELGATVADRLQKARPAACPK